LAAYLTYYHPNGNLHMRSTNGVMVED